MIMPKINAHHRVLILGSGPAGLTAAIYAARANLKPALVSGIAPGGQLMITTEVENYPGFPHGVKGPELMDYFRAQAERFETVFYEGDVLKVNLLQKPFLLSLEEGSLTCDALIIATGASAMWLNFPSEDKYKNRGVSACATCDGFFFRNQDVAVVGGGDTAMEEALYLSNLCKSVTVIVRRDVLRASKIMQARAFKNEKIKFLWNSAVDDVVGNEEKGMTRLRVKNLVSSEVTEHAITGLFVAIGHEPNTQLFKGQLDLTDKGYIKTVQGSTYTSVKGVFACGDVQDHIYRQAITAAGTGCMSAIDAERWLAEQEI